MTPRVIIASPMKCASTYVAAVLARYLRVSVPDVKYDWLAEQNFTYDLREQLRGQGFVLSLHMLPHGSNLEGIEAEGVRVALLWRNVADVVVSFDDHTRRYGPHNPIFHADGERFPRLPAQERFRYIADRMVPWNLGFYLRWRLLPVICFNPYELMLRGGFAFFRFLIWQLGFELDDERLRHVLAETAEPPRFNVGVAGRAGRLFDDDTKRCIERHIVAHPELHELEPLLWELPWESRELAHLSRLDGTTVRVPGEEQSFFVSRGTMHAVSDRWIASRSTPLLHDVTAVERDALAGLATGEALL